VADSFAAVGARGRQVDAVVKGTRYLEADVSVEGDLRRLLDAVKAVWSSSSRCRRRSR
jgi:hypothetical protein